MKVLFACMLAFLLHHPEMAIAQTDPSPEAEAFFRKAMPAINPAHVKWIKTNATEVNEKKLADEVVMSRAKAYGQLGNLSGLDIEALAFLVMMQASKSAQEDLKAIMAKVKVTNNTKEKLRELQEKIKKTSDGMANKDAGEKIGDNTSSLEKELRRADSLKRQASIKFTSTRNYTLPKTKADLEKLSAQLKKDMDSLNEMGEMESLRLQMAMDRTRTRGGRLASLAQGDYRG